MTCPSILLLNKEYPASETGVIEFLGELEVLADSQQWDMQTQNHWMLIGEEIATNIVKYAYPGESSDQRFRVHISRRDHSIVTEFIDWGLPFNPLAEEDPERNQTIEEMPIGGLGVFLVKQMADRLTYERNEEKNWLQIEKQLNSEKINQ